MPWGGRNNRHPPPWGSSSDGQGAGSQWPRDRTVHWRQDTSPLGPGRGWDGPEAAGWPVGRAGAKGGRGPWWEHRPGARCPDLWRQGPLPVWERQPAWRRVPGSGRTPRLACFPGPTCGAGPSLVLPCGSRAPGTVRGGESPWGRAAPICPLPDPSCPVGRGAAPLHWGGGRGLGSKDLPWTGAPWPGSRAPALWLPAAPGSRCHHLHRSASPPLCACQLRWPQGAGPKRSPGCFCALTPAGGCIPPHRSPVWPVPPARPGNATQPRGWGAGPRAPHQRAGLWAPAAAQCRGAQVGPIDS